MKTDNIKESDVISIKDITLSLNELEICNKIAQNTNNTWQTRNIEEKLKDTYLGKYAEKALKIFFSNDSFNNLNPYVAFYDDFRNDGFKKHNNIDFIFSKNINNLLFAQQYIQQNFSTNITLQQKNKLSENDIQIGEIKATRITNKYMNGEIIDLNKILHMDFLTYPSFLRKSSTISNTNDYLEYVSNKYNKTIEEIIKEEKENVIDWYFRVFIKEKENNRCDAYIIGALAGKNFFIDSTITPFQIKKMVQPRKSEHSIYLSFKINQGLPINLFKKQYFPTLNFPTHLSNLVQSNNTKNILNKKIKP